MFALGKAVFSCVLPTGRSQERHWADCGTYNGFFFTTEILYALTGQPIIFDFSIVSLGNALFRDRQVLHVLCIILSERGQL